MGIAMLILQAVLIVGIFGLAAAVLFFFRYRKTRSKIDYVLTIVSILLFTPGLFTVIIHFIIWLSENVDIDILDWSQTDLNVGLLLMIGAAIGLGICIWSFIRHKKTNSEKGGWGMVIGLLILILIVFGGIPLCAGYGHSII